MIKKFSLFLLAYIIVVSSGFSQVSESFDGLTQGAYGNYVYNCFEVNNGLCNSTNALSGNPVRLRNTKTSHATYLAKVHLNNGDVDTKKAIKRR